MIKPLIWANVLVFVFTGFGHYTPGDSNAFFGMLHLHPYLVQNWEFWRLGTYMFAHGGATHLFFNMWGLYLFGGLVEERLGPQRFLRLYLISGVIGGLAWLLANWWSPVVVAIDPRSAPDTLALQQLGIEVLRYQGELMATGPASAFREVVGLRVLHAYGGVVGASGAVFGVMMAAAMTAPNLQMMLLLPPMPIRLKTLVGVYAALEIVMAWSNATGHMQSRIAHLAHLGGLAGAFVYMKHLGHHNPWGFCRGLLDTWRYRRARRRFQRVNDGPLDHSGIAPAEVDRILDKIGRDGMGSLTADERRTLQEAGRRLRNTPGR